MALRREVKQLVDGLQERLEIEGFFHDRERPCDDGLLLCSAHGRYEEDGTRSQRFHSLQSVIESSTGPIQHT
jgi:hypothetical protein